MRRRPQDRRRSVDRGTHRPAIELRNHPFGVPTLLAHAEGYTVYGVNGEPMMDPAQSKTLSMCGNSSHGNREVPPTPVGDGPTGRPEKVNDRKSGRYVDGKSDAGVVPRKPPNKGKMPAEVVEGRPATEGNTLQEAASQTQSWTDALSAWRRVREMARCDRRTRFTKQVNWVLEADIQGFAETINHGECSSSSNTGSPQILHRYPNERFYAKHPR
jgi:hypothetical protein